MALSLVRLVYIIASGTLSAIYMRYMLSCVCLRLSPFSQLYFVRYVGLIVFGISISLLMIWRIFVFHSIIIIKSEIWIIKLCEGLDHKTMVCVVCLAMCLPQLLSSPYWFCKLPWYIQLCRYLRGDSRCICSRNVCIRFRNTRAPFY